MVTSHTPPAPFIIFYSANVPYASLFFDSRYSDMPDISSDDTSATSTVFLSGNSLFRRFSSFFSGNNWRFPRQKSRSAPPRFYPTRSLQFSHLPACRAVSRNPDNFAGRNYTVTLRFLLSAFPLMQKTFYPSGSAARLLPHDFFLTRTKRPLSLYSVTIHTSCDVSPLLCTPARPSLRKQQ